MATAAGGVVVWEWREDNDQWIPYGPRLCHEFEACHRTQRTHHQFSLGQHGPPMYEIDFSANEQMSLFSGKKRSVQRSLLSSTSVAAKGVLWEWFRGGKKSGIWTPYALNLADCMEEKYAKGETQFQFPARFKMCHVINLKTYKQVNINTGYSRNIRRRKLNLGYPPTSSSFTGTHASATLISPTQNGGIGNSILPGGSFTNANSKRSILKPATFQYGHANSPTPASATVPNMNAALSQPHYQNVGQRRHHRTPHVSNSTNMNSVLNMNVPGYQFAGTFSPQPTAAASVSSQANTGKYGVPSCPHDGIHCDTNSDPSGAVPASTVMKKFTKPKAIDPASTEDCAICQMPLTDESAFSSGGSGYETCELTLCNHVFHSDCVQASYEHGVKNGCIICPSCNKMHGVKTGSQPDGRMTYQLSRTPLPGYHGCGMYTITYDIRPGTQGKGHPHPGRRYQTQGFPRIAYLPDTDDGRKVLLLLVEAWKRRLIFTVGQSSTTGAEDCVTWTGIHHKTETHSRRGHGYPDDGYLDRVLNELAADGVTEDQLSASYRSNTPEYGLP